MEGLVNKSSAVIAYLCVGLLLSSGTLAVEVGGDRTLAGVFSAVNSCLRVCSGATEYAVLRLHRSFSHGDAFPSLFTFPFPENKHRNS